MPPRGQSMLRSFLQAMQGRKHECWIYPGHISPTTGYGRGTIDGRTAECHRLAYEYLVGAIPDGMEIDHLCRNRACCNPAHLEPVAHRVNMRRGQSPSAHQFRQTHCIHGHKLAGRNLWIDARGRRQCKACRRQRSAEYYARNRRRILAELRAQRHRSGP